MVVRYLYHGSHRLVTPSAGVDENRRPRGWVVMAAEQRAEGGLEPEEVHEILRNDRRRRTLRYLRQRLEPVSVRDLSEHVAAAEAGESPAPRDLRQSVYNSLHQTHLPKLDENGVLTYDTDRKTVELAEGARDITAYMGIASPLGVTWATLYRSLGVVGLLSVVFAHTVVPGLEGLLLATVFLAVFAVATAYQLWSRRWFYLRGLVGDD
jgi:hypothetical protein